MPTNILDTIKGAGLSSIVGLIGMLYPAAKPVIDSIQKDIADGKITEENFEETLNASLTFIEGFTSDSVDAILEQVKKTAHEAIILEKMIRVQSTKTPVEGNG